MVASAPAPHEIKWENMNYNQLVTRGRRIALLAIFVVVFFIFLTPTAFVRYINDALSGMEIDKYIEGIFTTYLPTLLLLIYQGVILYHSIIFIVKQEKRVNVAMEIVSRLTKYLIFMAIYVFLLQALGMQTVVQVSTGGWDGWRTLFPNKIAETGLFFTIFMIHQALIQNGLALLQPGLIIISKIKWKLAKTPHEKIKALDSPDFDFAYETAVTLNSFLILLSYSIAYPLILIIGLIYFFIRFMTQKYLILCTFYVNKSSTGSAIPKAYLYSILTYIFIFQLFTGLIFTINKNYPIQIVGGVLIIIAFVVYLIFLWKLPIIMKFVRKIIKKFEKIEGRKLDNFEHGEVLYIHPVEKKEKETGEADVVLLDTLASKTQNINTSNENNS
ncbi:unnamed protein product [Blepharisma stoltei]|uniref:CSC1/OSCA1-like 7TM region domain-containing protein n=1 Tax=Blepharisma stoltei TaxID=1481888 RepID=A0AAU9JWJ0_9CILI|nr:unnamed protein product [Blepharisma stoltei]